MTDPAAEWLEADGLGGFASGTVRGDRRRRYHATLLVARTPPTGRVALVSGFDAWVDRAGQPAEFLSVQRYAPDLVSRSGEHIAHFTVDPWPTWTYRLADGTEIEHQLFVPRDLGLVVLRWRLVERAAGVRLVVRPFLTGRDIHALHHENPDFRFDAQVTTAPAGRPPSAERPSAECRVRWQPYAGLPAVLSAQNGSYEQAPAWYRRFALDEERARGFDHVEDAGSPGLLSWDLSAGEATWLLAAEGSPGAERLGAEPPRALAERLRRQERSRRRKFASPLARAADAYLVRRGDGRTVVAGYPWFTDWGRDTFISLRGLCLATGRLDEARSILVEWAGAVSQGMLPNRFVDLGDEPEYNAVDASLWYVVAVRELIEACRRRKMRLAEADRRAMTDAVEAILEGYTTGTRYGIHQDRDGLLAAGVPGVQLTWMDAKLGDWVVTPRIGKPVEVQALWINALRAGGSIDARWLTQADRARASFEARFWNPARGCLFDVVDADGVAGRNDPTIRPNQVFAVGGLPEALLEGDRAASVVQTLERTLLTPLGLRSLAPDEPGYCPRYEGGPRERDGAYHQGTVWPWLLGPFVEAWLRTRGATAANQATARDRFLKPLLAHLDEAGLGHVSEIADAEPPHLPRGCPFQAWSVGEALRIDQLTSAPRARPARPAARRTRVR
jgi:predicted glycogen debranching enzyme